jgi:hypothetical protein
MIKVPCEKKIDIVSKLGVLEYRLQQLHKRKIVCNDWREHAILRFDIIDNIRARDNLVQAYKSIEK